MSTFSPFSETPRWNTVDGIADEMRDYIRGMKPGDKFKLERHDETAHPLGYLFTFTLIKEDK